jgi:hypothetical protein
VVEQGARHEADEADKATEAPQGFMRKTGLNMLVFCVSRVGTALARAVKWLRQTPCNGEDIVYNTRVRRGYAGHKAAAARRAKKDKKPAVARRAQASAAARKDAGATASSSILKVFYMSVNAAYNKMMSHASCLFRRAWEKIAFSVTRPLRRTIRLRFPSRREMVLVVDVLPWTRLSSIVKKRCWYDGEEVDKTRTLFSLGIVPGSTVTCMGRDRSRTPPCTSSASSSASSPRASSTSDHADECGDEWKRRVEFADTMMQILIKEEEAEKMRRVLLEKEMLAKKRSRLKSSRKAALRRAARSSTTTCSSRRHAQENGGDFHHTTPRSETMTEERQVKWAGSNDPFDIFLKLFDGTTVTLRNVRSLVSHRAPAISVYVIHDLLPSSLFLFLSSPSYLVLYLAQSLSI